MIRSRFMARFLALILMCLVSLSLVAGTVVHAAEPVGCLDSDVAAGLGHAEGDRDQIPADDGKAAPHHHGGCHGHQIGEPVKEGFATQVPARTSLPITLNAKVLVPASTDPAYRPPIA
jgi:hypothetical protein